MAGLMNSRVNFLVESLMAAVTVVVAVELLVAAVAEYRLLVDYAALDYL